MEVIMAEKRYLLMSIKPVYAKKIKRKEKSIELRCSSPKVSSGDILVIYESSPVQRVTAYCEIDSIITMPLTSFETLMPIGSNISLSNLYNNSCNTNYKPCQMINKTVDFL